MRRSLYVRTLIAFALVALISYGLAIGSRAAWRWANDRITPSEPSVETMTLQAQAALDRGGRDGLVKWIVQTSERYPNLEIDAVDPNGQEILRRFFPPILRRFPTGEMPLHHGAWFGTSDIGGGAQPNWRLAFIHPHRPRKGLDQNFLRLLLAPGLILAVGLLISEGLSIWFALSLTRPIVRLRSGVQALAAGDLNTRMAPDLTRRDDEVGALSREFDHMVGRVRGLLESKETLLRDVSHELRSPLARLRFSLGMMREDSSADPKAQLDQIDRELQRIDQLIGQILSFSRLSGPEPAREPVDLGALVEDVAADARIEAEPAGKRIALIIPEPVGVIGDAHLLRSAVENVLRNAVRFTAPDTAVEVTIGEVAGRAGITVRDHGPGVGPDDLPRLFEPFFRAENGDGSGQGLGLAIARRIVELHQGAIMAENASGGGLTIRLSLPAAPHKT